MKKSAKTKTAKLLSLAHKKTTELINLVDASTSRRIPAILVLLKLKHPVMAARLMIPGLFIGLVGGITMIYTVDHAKPPVHALIACPSGYADGCASAPTGTPQYASMLNGYVARPPWNVAGADYHVGIPSGTTLTPWRSATIANASINLGSGQITCSSAGATVTVDSIDFTPAGGASPYIYGYTGGCTWIIKNSKFTCPGTSIGNILSDKATITANDFDQTNCGDISTFIQGSNITIKYNWFKHSIQHILESGGPGPIDYQFNLIDDSLAQGAAAVCSAQACHENFQQLTGTGTINGDSIKFNTNYQHTSGTGNGEGFQFYCNSGPCQVNNPVLSNNTLICRPGTNMSNVINSGDASHPGNVVGGTNNDNYFDPSACNPYYLNTVTPAKGWTSSGNTNMNNGKTINPADNSETGGLSRASLEAETGTLGSNAIIGSDASASNGQFVKFRSIPAACNNGGTFLWNNLATCGWPGAGNVGYRAGNCPGGVLTASTLPKNANNVIRLSTANQTITCQDISGCVFIDAPNVTIRDSKITACNGLALSGDPIESSDAQGNGTGTVKINDGASATIDHVELNGLNRVHACIWHQGSSLTATGNNCYGMDDGIFSWASSSTAGDNFTITDNYLHGFTAATSNGHIDGYQTEGAANGVIRHNTIDVSQNQDSTIAIWNSLKSSANIQVENNLLAGGGFAVYAEDYDPSENSPVGGNTTTNITFTNNKFSTIHYNCVGGFAVWFFRASLSPYNGGPTDGWHRTGNYVLETGENIDNGNPHDGGILCS